MAGARSIDERVLAARELITVMTRLAAPPAVTGVAPPAPDADYTARLAIEAAASAEAIAEAIARLGLTDNQSQNFEYAETIWTETLAQLKRIQMLYGLPELPFQKKPLPEPRGS